MSSQDFEGPDFEARDVAGPGSERVGSGDGRRDGRPDGHGDGPPDDEVAAYAAEVRAQFADLPDADSAELLEDLEDHLREVAAEDAGTLRERLGAPAAYARELRQAAGLPEPGEGSGSGVPGAGAGPRRTLRSRLRSRVRQTVADAERRARGYRAGREVLDFLPSLRPAWWVLRAWVAVRLLEVMTTDVNPWGDIRIIPHVGNSTVTGLLALSVAVPASVYAARHTVPEGWRRRAMGAGEGILVLFSVGMALAALGNQGDYGDTASHIAYVQAAPQGLSEGGQPISNLYVYDQSGKLLNGVLVYDQDGRPVDSAPAPGGSPFTADSWLDGNGALVTNIFPRRILQPRWNMADGQSHFVVVPPPVVTIPQGVHRDPGVGDPQQSSATPAPSSASSAPSADATATPSPAATPSSSPTASPSASASGSVGGAHTPSAPPSTPAPPGATH